MQKTQGDWKIDLSSEIIIVQPPIESLLTIRDEDSFWPKELRDDPEIKKQTERRERLYAKLGILFQKIPKADMEISEALDSGQVDPELITEIYELLAKFLKVDPHHKRLVLYLPFELLPKRTWKPRSPKLKTSLNRFTSAYMRCWRDLLMENDVRANFVDGNILEPELSPNGQPLVRKAAHFIPQLVQKGYISVAEVLALLEKSTDEILQKSIVDTLPILADLGLLERAEGDRLLRSHGLLPLAEKTARSPKDTKDLSWFQRLDEEAEYELNKMTMRQALDFSRGLPRARVAWERTDREEKLIAKYADYIATLLVDGSLSPEDVCKFLSPPYEKIPCLATIRGLGQAIEIIAKTDLEEAKKVFRVYEVNITDLWQKNIPDTKDALTSILSRLRSLDLFDDTYLRLFGLALPQFDAPLGDSKKTIETITQKFVPAIQSIARDPELSRLIYPVAIFYGSSFKGYAKSNADLDVAVFIRPDISINERPTIQKALARIFADRRINGKVVEFWLTEIDGKLAVRNFPEADVLLADNTWMHLLFASVWLGTAEIIRELYTKLLPGFIYSQGKTFEGHDLRKIWLDEMEREVLQYRLMHKGYKRFYSEQGGISREHSEALGPESSFWDSGYRRVATKLFITKVFLPQLK